MTHPDQLLPHILNGMSSTGAGITDTEIDAMWARHGPWSADEDDLRAGMHAFARAVEARTRQATPAPDAVGEAVEIMRPFLDGVSTDCGEPDCGDCAPYRPLRAFIAPSPSPNSMVIGEV